MASSKTTTPTMDTPSTNIASTDHFDFLGLPLELRNMVYDFYMEDAGPYTMTTRYCSPPDAGSGSNSPFSITPHRYSLVYTNSDIQAEYLNQVILKGHFEYAIHITPVYPDTLMELPQWEATTPLAFRLNGRAMPTQPITELRLIVDYTRMHCTGEAFVDEESDEDRSNDKGKEDEGSDGERSEKKMPCQCDLHSFIREDLNWRGWFGDRDYRICRHVFDHRLPLESEVTGRAVEFIKRDFPDLNSLHLIIHESCVKIAVEKGGWTLDDSWDVLKEIGGGLTAKSLPGNGQKKLDVTMVWENPSMRYEYMEAGEERSE